MQVVGFFGVLSLVALMWLSGFQIVPEATPNLASANESELFASAGISTPTVGVSISNSRTQNTASLANSEPVSTLAFVASAVSVQAVQNIENNSALLRGSVIAGQPDISAVFFIYSYDKTDLERSIGSAKSYQTVLGQLRSGVSVRRVATNVSSDKYFETRVSSLAPDSSYHVRLCAEAVDRLICSRSIDFNTIPSVYRPGDARIPTIRVYNETPISAGDVIIKTTVNMRDTIDGEVYLVYGESQKQVGEAIGQEYNSIDRDEENLQKTRLGTDIRGNQTLSKTITDLEPDTQHYYVICVSYDGLLDGVTCSRQQTYKTYDEDFGESPKTVINPVGVSVETASLSGSVSLQGFNSAIVFFVYGTDLPAIDRITGETSMTRIRQSKDRMQRVLVDSDADRSGYYAVTVRDLLPAANYSARLCVQYENQNENYRDVPFVSCSAAGQFSTQ